MFSVALIQNESHENERPTDVVIRGPVMVSPGVNERHYFLLFTNKENNTVILNSDKNISTGNLLLQGGSYISLNDDLTSRIINFPIIIINFSKRNLMKSHSLPVV